MPARIPVGTFSPFEPKQTSKKPPRWEARSKYRQSDDVLRDVEKTGSSRGEVMAKMTQRFRELADEQLKTDHVTVGAFAREWADNLSEDRLAAGTIQNYRQQVTKYIEPEDQTLSTIPLADLTVDDCATYLDALVKSAGMPTAKVVRTCLINSLDLAVRRDLRKSNPARSIPPLVAPRGYATVKKEVKPTDRDTTRALTREERDRLVAFADADDFAQRMDLADLIAFMAGTGVRLGEAAAVPDDYLDLGDKPTACIGWALIRRPGEGLWHRPWTKTHEGEGVGARRPPRRLYLSSDLAERLRKRRERAGYADAPEGVVFPSPRGHLRDVENTAGDLKKVYVAAGFPWVTSHSFRRTVNALLDEAGFTPRERANVLGHVRTETTDTYYSDRFHPVERAASVL